MGSKLLTHEQALDLVYGAIATLTSGGRTKISISKVANIAGVSRSTINSKENVDWIEVRDVIQNNRSSPRVKLASVEIGERTKWQMEAYRFENELQNCQKNLLELTEFAENVYKKLLEQLHKYVYLAKQVPEKMDRESKVLIELQELKNRLEFIEAENRRLKVNLNSNSAVLPFVKKEIVEVYPETQRGNLIDLDLVDLTFDALQRLDSYFEKDFPPKVIYVLCGNFASGKSNWISTHKPLYKGIIVYIEGTNHSTSLRKIVLRYIRKLNSNCTVICVRILCDVSLCLKRNISDTRIRYKNNISEELIKNIEKNFEEISVIEGFNQIIIVGGS